MSLQMSESEICMMYRDAKDKNKQIEILADMNVCDSGEIIDVLSSNGFVPGLPVKPKEVNNGSKTKRPPTKFSVETVAEIERLYASGMWTGEIAEKLGIDYKVLSNKISNMGLPKKYAQNNRSKPVDNADKLYIETLQNELKTMDAELKKATTDRDAYKHEMEELIQENEYLREANKYREKFDKEVEALNDAVILIDLTRQMFEQNAAISSALYRASEFIGGVMKELM